MKPHSSLDVSYRLAFLVLILLWSIIWWDGFIDICRAFLRWL